MGDEPSRAGPAIADVLARAADLLKNSGAWLRLRWSNAGSDVFAGSCWCIEGALARASRVHPLSVCKGDPARALAEHLGIEPKRLSQWNDTPGRTHAEVVAALRATAALARDGASLSPSNPSHNPGEEG